MKFMRTITDHKLAGLNDALEIKVLDEPGHGGACHRYNISAVTNSSFQAGPYASEDNAQALHHLEQALFWLQKRTRDRLARGVEGTSVK